MTIEIRRRDGSIMGEKNKGKLPIAPIRRGPARVCQSQKTGVAARRRIWLCFPVAKKLPHGVLETGSGGWRNVAGTSLIFGVTFLAYLPAINGGLLWDDDAHVTKAGLQSLDGLRRIWFELGATQQYYPLLHSAFWIEHRLWGAQ